MLARSLGFSARLVGGYYIDPLALVQEVYPIQSHAFTEIPFEDLGWIIFDATPPADISDMIGQIPDMNLTEGNPMDGLDFEYPQDSGAAKEKVFRIYGMTGSNYLRDAVGEFYNGSWYLSQGLPVAYDGQVIQDSVTGYDTVSEFTYIIEPRAGFDWYIPGPQNPVQINAYDPLTYYPDQKLFGTETAFITPYQVVANEYIFSDTALENAEPYATEPYLQISDELAVRLRALAQPITMYEPTPYDKIKALSDYLKENYVYSTEAEPAPADIDPVVWFLFYEKQGICTDYASALTLLARSIGIPARLVTGWLINPSVEVQDVEARQAHAYTEVLFDGLGWVVFDATASAAPDVNLSTGLTPTFTNITYQDEVVSVGGEFTVAGTVVDEMGGPVDGLDVLVYLKREKTDAGVLSGRGNVNNGYYNITCVFPANLPGGEYMVDVHTIGDDTYMDSWSDPPIVAYTETSFIFDAPETVVAGKSCEIVATLVNSKTNSSIPYAQCTVDTGSETLNRVTDGNGEITLTDTFSAGEVEITFSWEGEEYTHGSTTSLVLQSVPLQATLPPETVLVRGERSTIRGKVQAGSIIGANEPITLSLLGKETSSVTNEAGEFFITQSIPSDTALGPTPMNITIREVDETTRSLASVKAQTRLDLTVPNSAQGDSSIDVSVKLLDDTGWPLTTQSVNITYRYSNQTFYKVVQTDPQGVAETSIKLPRAKGQLTMRASYFGQEYYLPSTASQVINLISPNQFPLLPLAALILLVGGVAGLIYLRGKREANLVAPVVPEVVDENASSRLSLRLPGVEPGLPPVWNTDPLLVEGRMVSTDGVPMSGQSLRFTLPETEVFSGVTGENGEVSFSKSFGLGVQELRLINEAEGLHTILRIKIVDYREEIIRLFNNRFKEAREQFERIKDNYTARELYNYLKEHTPEVTHDSLWELVSLFEEANYSLHVINRSHYTRFYYAMRTYREVLDAEVS